MDTLMDTLMENTVLNIKNRSHSVTAEVEVSAGKTDGVLIAQGGRFAGWSLYAKEGKPNYAYNWFDADYYYVKGTKPQPEGTVCLSKLAMSLLPNLCSRICHKRLPLAFF
jgi:arylsulfatase